MDVGPGARRTARAASGSGAKSSGPVTASIRASKRSSACCAVAVVSVRLSSNRNAGPSAPTVRPIIRTPASCSTPRSSVCRSGLPTSWKEDSARDRLKSLTELAVSSSTPIRSSQCATIKSTRVKITEAGHRARFCLRPQSCGPAGTIVSLDEAEAAFRAAWDSPLSPEKPEPTRDSL